MGTWGKVKRTVFPQEIAGIPEKAFYSCMKLEKVGWIGGRYE